MATWALHNALKSWTLYNLSESELKLLILSLSENEIKLAKVCSQGSQEWASLNKSTYALFFTDEAKKKHSDSTGFPAFDIRHDSVLDTSYFIVKTPSKIVPRLHKRYEMSVSCSLVGADNKVFTSETLDLSEGGLYFKDVIPNWVAGYFLVIVNERYQLMCSLVEDQKEKRRVQIVSEESDLHFMQYKDWINTL